MNIHKLNLKRDQRELAKFKLYKKVLNRIYRKIEQTSNSYQTSLFYQIPEYIFGIPRYNIIETSKYIVAKLQEQGYVVVYTPPNFIFVSWEHIPSELKLEYEPIVNTQKNSVINYRHLSVY